MQVNRRKAQPLDVATLVALVMQLALLLFTVWHGEREVHSIAVRDAAIERIVEDIDMEVRAAAHASPPPSKVK